MIYMLVFYLILLFISLYFINQFLNNLTKEKFENQQYLKLSPNIIDNICPPNPNTTYSFKINENYCTSNLFCPNKSDLCVNNHCVPGDIPFPPTVLANCYGCPKPGLV